LQNLASQITFGLQPVIQVMAELAAAIDVDLIGPAFDVLYRNRGGIASVSLL
jgi:hypothetical protein